jgi:hypothetical protein
MQCIWISSYHKLRILPPKEGYPPHTSFGHYQVSNYRWQQFVHSRKAIIFCDMYISVPWWGLVGWELPNQGLHVHSHNPDTMEFMHPRWWCLSPRGPNLVACMNTIMLIKYFVEEETTKGTTHVSAFPSFKNYILIHFASFKNQWTRWKKKKLFLTYLSMVLYSLVFAQKPPVRSVEVLHNTNG